LSNYTPKSKFIQEDGWLKELRTRIESALHHSETMVIEPPPTPAFDRLLKKEHDLQAKIQELRVKSEVHYPSLSDSALAKVKEALSPGSGTICEKFNIAIQKHDIHTLIDGRWLNDEVINFYGHLIQQRANRQPEQYPKIHVFSTFFYTTLEKGYVSVRRWTRKVNPSCHSPCT
jgi:sentrin-specific protease 1